MRSKTSYFNKTVFFKTIIRFWPIWFAYAIVWLAVLPLGVGSALRYNSSALDIRNLVLSSAQYGGIIIGGIAAIFSAMAVWSFMYSSRSVSGTASLPLRRENIFCSVTLAGLLPLIAVNIIVFFITMVVQALHGSLDMVTLLQWLAIVTMILVFFYGFATFCAQLTGNIIVLPVVYVILNFTFIVVEMLVRAIGSKFIFGLQDFGNYVLMFLSPPVELFTSCHVVPETTLIASTGRYMVLEYYFSGWLSVGMYALAGIAFAIFSLLLYRRRRMETAGDVVAVNILKPVFKYCLTLGCALCVGWILYEITYESYSSVPGRLPQMLIMLLFMLLGAFFGYFAAEMLINKSFRVFKGRWLGFGISAAVIIVLMFSAELDLFGYEANVPDASDVDYVSLSYGGEYTELHDAQNIIDLTELHQSIVVNKSYHEDNYKSHEQQYLQMNYVLKNGKTVVRQYGLSYLTEQPDTYGDVLKLQEIANSDEAIQQRKERAFEYTLDNLISGSCSSWVYKAEFYELAQDGDYARSNDEFSYYDYYEKYSGNPIAVEDTAVDVITEPADDEMGTYFSWEFTPEEIMDLFYNCIVPDIEDGKLGRIWLIENEDYTRTVYATEIRIDAREPSYDPNSSDRYNYDYFYTVPTVDSVRTNQWLEAHGVILHTIAELAVNK